MTVAGNVKEVLTIVLGVMISELRITRENAVGVVLTVLGGAGYAFVEYLERKERRERGMRGHFEVIDFIIFYSFSLVFLSLC